jgi:prophage regulatory protein
MIYDKSLDCIVRIRAVLERTGLSRSTVYRKIQEGTFPQSVKLGKHASGWRESDVNQWVSNPTAYGK